jgi:hypothetical protein
MHYAELQIRTEKKAELQIPLSEVFIDFKEYSSWF